MRTLYVQGEKGVERSKEESGQDRGRERYEGVFGAWQARMITARIGQRGESSKHQRAFRPARNCSEFICQSYPLSLSFSLARCFSRATALLEQPRQYIEKLIYRKRLVRSHCARNKHGFVVVVVVCTGWFTEIMTNILTIAGILIYFFSNVLFLTYLACLKNEMV